MDCTDTTKAAARSPIAAGMSQIIVSHAYGIAVAEMRAPGRGGRKAAHARQVAMYLSHVVFAMSGDDVAHAFGRERSTAYHAFQRIEALRENPELDRTLGWLEEMLRSAAAEGP
jgi:chromosomal replication initiation ATPase DnaA